MAVAQRSIGPNFGRWNETNSKGSESSKHHAFICKYLDEHACTIRMCLSRLGNEMILLGSLAQ
jgi:hypothetical protein